MSSAENGGGADRALFMTSSQKKYFLSDEETLLVKRQAQMDRIWGQLRARHSAENLSENVTVDQQIQIQQQAELKIIRLCKQLFPKVVTRESPIDLRCTAIHYLKRFTLEETFLEYDPTHVAIACLFLASKTEECYVPLEHLAQKAKVPKDRILALEVPILQASRFKLKCWHPFHPLECFLIDVKNLYKKQKRMHAKQTSNLRNMAKKKILAYELSDLVFLYPPSQLALAALRFAGRQRKGDSKLIDEYIEKRFSKKPNYKKFLELLNKIDETSEKFEELFRKNCGKNSSQWFRYYRELYQQSLREDAELKRKQEAEEDAKKTKGKKRKIGIIVKRKGSKKTKRGKVKDHH